MIKRALLLNVIGIVLGITFAFTVLSNSYAQPSTERKDSPDKKTKVIDEHNNDYTFPSQKDFKNHPILESKLKNPRSFDVKPAKIKPSIDKEIAELEKEKLKRERKEEKQFLKSQEELHKVYLENIKKRKELMKDIKDDLEDLEDYEISDEEAAPQIWD